MNLILSPKVYLVGRPSINFDGLAEFFMDEGVEFSTPDKKLTYINEPEHKVWESDTSNASELLCTIAGKICYDAYGKGRSVTRAYIGHIIESGHGSVLEHVTWNFIIKGVSRTFSHEHVRHRAGCAISQRSQRYVKESDAGIVAQHIIENNAEAKKIFENAVAVAQESYEKLVAILTEDMKKVIPDSTLRIKTVRSAARSVMPNATETYLFWSANARALRHYIEMRASEFADIEIRNVALQILKIMQTEAPSIFEDYTILNKDNMDFAYTAHRKV